jgi:hypothetical protein
MEVPELPRDVWQEIMKLRHENAVEEMMPRWRAEHKKRTADLRKELYRQVWQLYFKIGTRDAEDGVEIA